MKTTPEKVLARLMFKGLDKMTKSEGKKVAKWVRSRADWIENHGDLADSTFRQTLYY